MFWYTPNENKLLLRKQTAEWKEEYNATYKRGIHQGDRNTKEDSSGNEDGIGTERKAVEIWQLKQKKECQHWKIRVEDLNQISKNYF